MIERMWEHAGMVCALRHGAFGAPCGYVFVPEGHPLYGDSHLDAKDELDVHGGVTFTGVIEEDPGLGWAVGFDMAHSFDVEYSMLGVYCIRSDEECVEETNRLAEQLAERGER